MDIEHDHRRRRFLQAVSGIGAIGLAGCLGPELSYDDTPPADDSDGNGTTDLEATTIREIVEFARETNELLSQGEETLTNWEEDPDSVPNEDIHELSVMATEQLNTYDETVFPNRDELAGIERGDEVDGERWEFDGSALVEALGAQESLVFTIENAAIAIMDADGNPEGVSSHGWSEIETVQSETEAVQSAINDALGDHA